MDSTERLDDKSADSESENVITTSEGKKHFARNTASSIVFFAFNAVTSLLMVPYLIHRIGIENYGMVALANSFISRTQVFTIVSVGTVTRFVMLYAARGENETARRYFSTQFTAIVAMCAIILPVAGVLSYLTPKFVKIPPGQTLNTQWLFFLCYLAFIPTLFVSPLQVAQFIKQRFDIRNMLDILNQVFRYGTWIVMFAVMTPAMWHVGLGYVAGSTVVVFATWLVFIKLTPHLRPKLGVFDKVKFFEMIRMGGWVTVNQVGSMLYLSVDAIVINRLMNPASVGKYGTILGLFVMLRTMSGLMSGMMMPITISYYARNDWAGLIRNSAKAVKFMSLGMSVPIGLACGFIVPFIVWWLGPEFTSLRLVAWLLLAPQVWNSSMEPLFAINNAANKVAIPGVVAVLGGLIKLSLAIVLVKYTSLGLVGVALANLIAFGLKNIVFTPIYAAHILKSSSLPFYRATIPSVFIFALVAGVSWWVTQVISLNTFPKIAGVGLGLLAIFALFVYRFAMNNDDRRFLAQVAPWKKKGAQAS
ncbi:MAG: oligosaccharide flippase family protein [Armatimonadetes bacterium]|nr:oligosaccharide flippase family protein [Armatimonadota bacterium]